MSAILGKVKIIAASAAAPVAAGALVSDEHARLIAVLAAFAAAVAGLITWIDFRISKQIETHGREDVARHHAVLLEISHVREMLGLPPRPEP